MKNRVLILFLVGLFGVEDLYAGSPGIYREQYNDILRKVHEILMENGYCDEEKGCAREEYILIGTGKWGLDIGIYGLSSNRLIAEILHIFLSQYSLSDEKITIKVEVYKEKHKEIMGFLSSFKHKPFIEVYIEGK